MRYAIFFLIITFLHSCNEERNVSQNSSSGSTTNDSISLSKKYYNEGQILLKNGESEKAKKAFKLALDNCISSDVKKQYKYFSNLFGIYLSKNEFGDALELIKYFDNLEIFPEDQKKKIVYAAYISAYKQSLKYDEALDYTDRLMLLSKETNDNLYQIHAALNESSIYMSLRNTQKGQAILKNLITNENLELSLLQKSYIYGDLGAFDYYQKNYKSAIENYKKSLTLINQLKSENQIDNTGAQYANIAEAYIELNDISKAKIYLDSFKGLDQGKISNNRRRSVFKYELRIARIENRDNKRIEQLIDKTTKDQETFYTNRYDKELESLTEEKERSEALLIANQKNKIEKLNLRNNAFIVGAILSVSLLIILFFMFKQRRDHLLNSLKNQQRLLRAQMNPHFTFNVLSNIQDLVRRDSKSAAKYITKFSRLLRSILENSTQNQVPVKDEVEVLLNYLDLQELRFPDLFEYIIETDKELDNEMITTPPMLMQPFVENAIEHGFKGISYKGVLRIVLKQVKLGKKKHLECTIIDNGVGYHPQKTTTKKSTSINLIADFIKKSMGSEIDISPYDTDLKTGTIVKFQIPIY